MANSTIIPCLMYRDARAAIDWLVRVFGFQLQSCYPGEGDTVAHAQLTFQGGMLMLGTVKDSEYGRLTVQPDEIQRRETQAPYLVVPDADAVYERLKAAGGEIVIDIRDEDYGGRGFTGRDLEGHLWTVGTYDPWA